MPHNTSNETSCGSHQVSCEPAFIWQSTFLCLRCVWVYVLPWHRSSVVFCSSRPALFSGEFKKWRECFQCFPQFLSVLCLTRINFSLLNFTYFPHLFCCVFCEVFALAKQHKSLSYSVNHSLISDVATSLEDKKFPDQILQCHLSELCHLAHIINIIWGIMFLQVLILQMKSYFIKQQNKRFKSQLSSLAVCTSADSVLSKVLNSTWN